MSLKIYCEQIEHLERIFKFKSKSRKWKKKVRNKLIRKDNMTTHPEFLKRRIGWEW